MRKIIIENLRCIKKLELSLPQKQGIYLLVGANGRGKSSILTCLDKICNSYAFQYGFRALPKGTNVDSYQNTKITYICNDLSITYTKKDQRWVAAPLKNVTQCLKNFNYSNTLFISADPKRISYATEEPGSRRKYIPANLQLIDNLNYLFDTERFKDLYILYSPSGKGRHKNQLYCIKSGREVYTEKQFSSGELAMIKLLSALDELKGSSLILIDEVELALHPRTQKRLYVLLNKLVKDKNLTVFLSTHSPSLIYQAKPEQIILVKDNEVISPCSHAMALGDIDIFEPNYLDNIYFVEDHMAMIYLECVLKRYISCHPEYIKFNRIYPVGGYRQTAELGVTLKNEALSTYKVIVYLDEDVKTTQKLDEDKPTWEVDNEFRQLYFSNRDTIYILPITPEVGLIGYIEKIILQGILQKNFHADEHEIKAELVIKGNSRKEYKNILSNIVCKLAACSHKSYNDIYRELFNLYVSILELKEIDRMVDKFES